MSDTKHAGRYIAEDRGAFTPEPAPARETVTSTAPLEDTAMSHMSDERLIQFHRWYGDLD